MGAWGWQQGEGPERYVFALLVPLVAAAAWGVLAVPGDRSRSGKAPVAVPGAVRLGVEAAFFAFAVLALYEAGGKALALNAAKRVKSEYQDTEPEIVCGAPPAIDKRMPVDVATGKFAAPDAN